MEAPQTIEAFSLSSFGRRKAVPRGCVVEEKSHIRKFLGNALEEIGFVTAEFAQVDELSAELDGPMLPDLVVVGFSAGGMKAAIIIEALAAKAFYGKVLLVGPRDLLMVAAVQELGVKLGIAMLPKLSTPFDSAGLRNSLAALLPTEALPNPLIDAAEALSAGWIELWYQPKFNTHTLQLCGAEAQVRIRHPTWGIIPRAQFLPDIGDFYHRALSNFLIRQVIADWHYFITNHRGVELAINLPFSFFRDPESVVNLCRQLPEHPAFQGLIIELEAADIIQNLDLAKTIAGQLRFSNIAISVDNLGVEWPALVGLLNVPFGEIKVDHQFIVGCGEDRLRRTVCRQIRDLADSYGIRVIADGVATRAEFFAVREMEFDLVQGPLFAKPTRAQTFALARLCAAVSGAQ